MASVQKTLGTVMIENKTIRCTVLVPVFALSILTGCGGSSAIIASPSTQQVSQGTRSVARATTDLLATLDPIRYIGAPLSGLAGAPTVSLTLNFPNVVATMDYGSGTVGSAGIERSGSVVVSYNTISQSGTVSWQNFTIDGEPVSGTVALSNVTVSAGNVSFDADFDVVTRSTHVVGTGSYEFNSTSSVIRTAIWTVTDQNQQTYQIQATNLVIEKNSPNSIPSSGSIVATVPYTLPGGTTATQSLDIEFDQQSPVTGFVLVRANGLPPIPVKLTGF